MLNMFQCVCIVECGIYVEMNGRLCIYIYKIYLFCHGKARSKIVKL